MNWLESLFNETHIDTFTIFLRLFLSMVLGGMIGLEREFRREPAGLRTHILICMGATLLMIISIYIPQTFKNFQNGDPGRIAAQVVSGIGFLGGGAIFRLGANIKGLTTAATIWASAAVGLAVGTGIYLGAFFTVLLVLFVLIGLKKVENRFFPGRSLKSLQIRFQATKIATDPVFTILERFDIKWSSLNIQQSLDKKQTKLKLIIEIPNQFDIKKLYKDLRNIENVTEIGLGHDF